jgi:hypothetical protein
MPNTLFLTFLSLNPTRTAHNRSLQTTMRMTASRDAKPIGYRMTAMTGLSPVAKIFGAGEKIPGMFPRLQCHITIVEKSATGFAGDSTEPANSKYKLHPGFIDPNRCEEATKTIPDLSMPAFQHPA